MGKDVEGISLVIHQSTSLSFTWRDGDILNLQVGRTCYSETLLTNQHTMCKNAEKQRYQIFEKFVKKFGQWKSTWIGMFITFIIIIIIIIIYCN